MIGIINYGVGNLTSVKNACATAGADAEFIMKPEDVKNYSHLLLPGVGAFGECMRQFHEHGFTADMLKDRLTAGVPLLGICVGMQMLATVGEEFGVHDGLNLIPGRVIRFTFTEPRVPHVGWNTVKIVKHNPLFQRIEDGAHFYFDHGYHLTCDAADHAALGVYGGEFVAAVQRDNIFAVQFHPEKSQRNGLVLLRNYLNLVKQS